MPTPPTRSRRTQHIALTALACGLGGIALTWYATSNASRIQARQGTTPHSAWRAMAGAREPSGAVALPKSNIFLVVDDEPKRAPQRLGLFVYRAKQNALQHLPLRWTHRSKRRWDDWEGITHDGKRVYLMTSHSRRKGKRARICHFPIKALSVQPNNATLGATLTCFGGKRQRRTIKAILDAAQARYNFQLAAGWDAKGPKRGGLDLEGFTYQPTHKRFLLGLRGPLATQGQRQYALLLSMTHTSTTPKPQFAFAGLVDLGNRGIRSLHRWPDGRIIASAGPVGNRGRFGLFRMTATPRPNLHWQATPVHVGTTLAPGRVEGMAGIGKRLFLWSDSGSWYTQRRAHYRMLLRSTSGATTKKAGTP